MRTKNEADIDNNAQKSDKGIYCQSGIPFAKENNSLSLETVCIIDYIPSNLIADGSLWEFATATKRDFNSAYLARSVLKNRVYNGTVTKAVITDNQPNIMKNMPVRPKNCGNKYSKQFDSRQIDPKP